VLVLDVDQGEDLVQLEGNLKESPEVLVSKRCLIFKSELLVDPLRGVGQQDLE